jgi:FkbM family methyltransferase
MSARLASLRRVINRSGWDLCRYRIFYGALNREDVDFVIDVGGNRGQFGLELRSHGYKGRLMSFEPLAAPYQALERVAAADGRWQTRRQALGRSAGEITLNVFADDRFSSANVMKEAHTEQVGCETVKLGTLDAAWDSLEIGQGRVFLKIDTQGFEEDVLAGAEGCLEQLCGVQLEVAWRPIYENQWKAEAAISYLDRFGFRPVLMRRGFDDGRWDRECDMIFWRS